MFECTFKQGACTTWDHSAQYFSKSHYSFYFPCATAFRANQAAVFFTDCAAWCVFPLTVTWFENFTGVIFRLQTLSGRVYVSPDLLRTKGVRIRDPKPKFTDPKPTPFRFESDCVSLCSGRIGFGLALMMFGSDAFGSTPQWKDRNKRELNQADNISDLLNSPGPLPSQFCRSAPTNI